MLVTGEEVAGAAVWAGVGGAGLGGVRVPFRSCAGMHVEAAHDRVCLVVAVGAAVHAQVRVGVGVGVGVGEGVGVVVRVGVVGEGVGVRAVVVDVDVDDGE